MKLRRKILQKFGYEKIRPRVERKDPFETLFHWQPQALTIFDVGAHVGESSLTFRKLFPNASIHCFEPLPACFDKLQNTFKDDRSVNTFQLALSNRVGIETFHVNRTNQTNSLLPRANESVNWVSLEISETINQIQVPLSTLDIFCQEKGIDQIDILKIDAQGSDLEVLKGAQKLLSNKKVKWILVEIIFVPLYEGQGYFHEITAFLAGFGYHLFDFLAPAYAEDGRLAWADAIYCNSPK